MRDSQQKPLLAKWPFYLSNSLLVAVAVLLAFQSRDSLSGSHIFWCIFSVLTGAILFVYPFYHEFKAHISLQKSKNTGLSREQSQRLDQTLYQLQELKDNILQHSHKQVLDQNLTVSTLQSIEERLNSLIEKAAALQKPSEGYSIAFAGLESKLQTILEKLNETEAALSTRPGSDFKANGSQQPFDPVENVSAVEQPVAAFFRNVATPSVEDAATSHLGTIDDTLHALYPHLDAAASAEKTNRNVFAEDSPSESTATDAPFSFDLDSLVTQNILTHQDDASDFLNHSHAYSPVQVLESSRAGEAFSTVESTPSQDTPTFTPLAEEACMPEFHYNLAQGTSLVVHANLGIGKKPYIRGQGPGLNWIYGAPMSFVELGKWQWTAPDSSQPIICRIYKNDEVPADGEVLCLQPGEQLELSPVFKA